MPRRGKRNPFKRPVPLKRRGVCQVCHKYGEVTQCPNDGCTVTWHDGNCGQWAWDTHHKLSCGKPPYALHLMLFMLRNYEMDVYDRILYYMGRAVQAFSMEPCEALRCLEARIERSSLVVPRRLVEAVEELSRRDAEDRHYRLQLAMGAPTIKQFPVRIAISKEMFDWINRLCDAPESNNPRHPFWNIAYRDRKWGWDQKTIFREFNLYSAKGYATTY